MIKKILLSIFIVFASFLCLVIVGVYAPIILINNGINQFKGEKYIYAVYAYRETLSYIDDVLWVTTVRVTKVDLIKKQRDPDCLIPGDTQLKSQYQAEVKVYGLWGISRDRYIVPCSGDLQYINN